MTMVTVVVPVYNVERYLGECLDSLVGQTLTDIQIVCVDDGSTDGSGALLAQYASRDDRIRVVTQQNRGLGGARNTGLRHASGRYIMFLDSDDYLEAGALEELVGLCEAHDADIAVCRLRYFYMDSGESVVGTWTLRTDMVPCGVPFNRRDVNGLLYDFVTPSACNKLIRREFLERHDLRFHEELRRAEDVPFTFVSLACAERIVATDSALLNYRKSVADSLQSTTHEVPLGICHALVHAHDDLERAGVLAEVEPDFMNAALYQCIFTLESHKTLEAFCELYTALADTYFDEIGISGHESDYFVNDSDREKRERIMSCGWFEYLFDEAQLLNRALADSRRNKARMEREHRRVTTKIERIRSSRGFRFGHALTGFTRRARNKLSHGRGGE